MGRTTYIGETRLAMGGMAEVLVAVEQNDVGIPSFVVLKRLLPHLADDPETVEDFLNEARVMVALHHPNIVNVRDLSRDDDGFYIVQEYLSGEDLRRVLSQLRDRETTVPAPIACRIAAEVAAALQYTHRASGSGGQPIAIVHRDVNPANVVLMFDGRVKLIDFGVAKSAWRQRTTQPGAIKGQAAYVAPEILQGEDADHRADIFSLGVVLHEMLTGRLLFHRENPAAVLDAILNDDIPPTRDFNPRVPDILDAVVMNALARDPAKRYYSAGQLREALEDVLRAVRAPVGTRQLASWLQTSMADSRRARIQLERDVRKKAGVGRVRGATQVPPVAKPFLLASPRKKKNRTPAIGVASLIAVLLLLLVIAAFLAGRSAAGGPGTAGT